MNMNAASTGPRASLSAVALMVQRAVETLRWLQPLAKVTRVRSLMCEIALASPSDLTQRSQQQQQGIDVASAGAAADVGGAAAAAAAAGGGGPTQDSSSRGSSGGQQFAGVERQLWEVVDALVGRLAAPSARLCRKQVGVYARQ